MTSGWTLGYVNHDLSFFKNFNIAWTGRSLQTEPGALQHLQLRCSGRNVDTSAQFNPNTGAQTDTNFGTVTGTREGSARVIQIGARFTF